MIKVCICKKATMFRDSTFSKRSLSALIPRYLWRAALKQMQSIKMCLTVRGEWQLNLTNATDDRQTDRQRDHATEKCYRWHRLRSKAIPRNNAITYSWGRWKWRTWNWRTWKCRTCFTCL